MQQSNLTQNGNVKTMFLAQIPTVASWLEPGALLLFVEILQNFLISYFFCSAKFEITLHREL